MVRTLPSQQEGHGLDSLMGELLSVEFASLFVSVRGYLCVCLDSTMNLQIALGVTSPVTLRARRSGGRTHTPGHAMKSQPAVLCAHLSWRQTDKLAKQQ